MGQPSRYHFRRGVVSGDDRPVFLDWFVGYGRSPGRAVFWSTLAFSALFHMLGACFRRAAILALLYAFFLETIMGNMPGQFKRLSISFYIRCLMFDRAHDYGQYPEQSAWYMPVDGTTAWLVLAGITVCCLILGVIVFTRNEYLDVN